MPSWTLFAGAAHALANPTPQSVAALTWISGLQGVEFGFRARGLSACTQYEVPRKHAVLRLCGCCDLLHISYRTHTLAHCPHSTSLSARKLPPDRSALRRTCNVQLRILLSSESRRYVWKRPETLRRCAWALRTRCGLQGSGPAGLHSSACIVCAHGLWRPTERPLCEADVSLLKLSTELHWYACSCLRQLGCGEAVCGPREFCWADLCACTIASIIVAIDASMLPRAKLIMLSHQSIGTWRRAQVLFVPR